MLIKRKMTLGNIIIKGSIKFLGSTQSIYINGFVYGAYNHTGEYSYKEWMENYPGVQELNYMVIYQSRLGVYR